MANTLTFLIHNTAGMLSHCINIGDFTRLRTLFSPDAVLELPDEHRVLNDIDEIIPYLQKRYTEKREILCLNSPSLKQTANGWCADYFVTSFEILPAQPNAYTYVGGRILLTFSETDSMIIKRMVWHEMLSLMPEPVEAFYPERLSDAASFDNSSAVAFAADVMKCPHAEQAVAALNTIGRDCHTKVSAGSVISLYSPVLTEGEQTICADFYGIIHTSQGECLRTEVCRIRYTLQQTDGMEIRDCTPCTVLVLPLQKMTPFAPPQASAMMAHARSIAVQTDGSNPSPEDWTAICNASTAWVDAIRTCDPSVFYDTVLAKEDPRLSFHVIRPVSGLAGFYEQCATMRDMDCKQPKKQGNHTLTTPFITPCEADEAIAYFFDYGWTMFAGAFGVAEPPYPVLPSQARYILRFCKRDGQWFIYDFFWSPLYQHGAWRFDNTLSRGWAGSSNQVRWPHSFCSYNPDAQENEFLKDPMEGRIDPDFCPPPMPPLP